MHSSSEPPRAAHSERLRALLSLLALERLPRTGWIQAGVAEPESIAAHAHGACLLALALGPDVAPPLALERAVCLLTAHDAPEALLGDLPRSASAFWPAGAKRAAEERAAQAVLAPLGAYAHDCLREYVAGETREARFARACDRLQMVLRCLGYVRAGARGLEDFERALDECERSEFAPCASLARELRQAFAAEKRA